MLLKQFSGVLIFILAGSGCSIYQSNETGSFYLDRQSIEDKLCAGMYEVHTPLSNGPKVTLNKNMFFFTETAENVEKNYVAQSSPENCWAASLETAFKAVNINYSQKRFLDALNKHCPISLSDSATLNQVIFAATDVHLTDGGKWIGQFKEKGLDIDFGDLFNMLNLIPGINAHFEIQTSYQREAEKFFLFREGRSTNYSSSNNVNWTTSDKNNKIISRGGIRLILTLSDLLSAMDNDYPVIVGLNESGGGHTVVLRKVNFFAGGGYKSEQNDRYSYTLNQKDYLDYVEYLDPLSKEPLQKEDGDYFLQRVAFAFYIDP